MNDWDEPRETIEKFAKEKELKHTILLMGGEMSPKLYGVMASPTSFWIDHQGVVLRRDVGFDPLRVPAMEKRIQRLLAEMDAKDEGKDGANAAR